MKLKPCRDTFYTSRKTFSGDFYVISSCLNSTEKKTPKFKRMKSRKSRCEIFMEFPGTVNDIHNGPVKVSLLLSTDSETFCLSQLDQIMY